MTLLTVHSFTAAFGWTRFSVSGYFGVEKNAARE